MVLGCAYYLNRQNFTALSLHLPQIIMNIYPTSINYVKMINVCTEANEMIDLHVIF